MYQGLEESGADILNLQKIVRKQDVPAAVVAEGLGPADIEAWVKVEEGMRGLIQQ